jgi:hypothetical protein
VAVNGSELTADQIFIKIGARAAMPPIPGLDRVRYLTNSSMMERVMLWRRVQTFELLWSVIGRRLTPRQAFLDP